MHNDSRKLAWWDLQPPVTPPFPPRTYSFLPGGIYLAFEFHAVLARSLSSFQEHTGTYGYPMAAWLLRISDPPTAD